MPTWLQRLSGADAGLPADERRRRRLEIGLILGAILVFAIFATLETWMPEYGEITTLPGNLLFFLLINLNLILLILTVFLVLRNFTKLALERRHGILGARLRTRLVLAFVGLTLIPTTLLFLVAQGFLARAFESWFSVRVESALQGALEVAQITYQQSGDNALHFAKEIGAQVTERNLWVPRRRTELQTFLERKTREYGLAKEIEPIRRECGQPFLIVTPGVRPSSHSWGDQKRVMTPAEAIGAGADYIVVGRSIFDAADPVVAAREIVADMETAAPSGRRMRLLRTE